MEGSNPQPVGTQGGRVRLLRLAALLVTLAGTAALIIACGGGESTDDASPDPVAETKRAEAQGLFDRLPVSWTPTSLVFSLNPGARQDVPITLTSKTALKEARIVFVPDLRYAVTVSPATIPLLEAGQSTTVTLTFAPSATETRKYIAGIVLLHDKGVSISRPLPVKVSLVKPETINGVAVPPEPPADLNNVTLAGFDTNGNGVRDDVDRLVAQKFGGSADLPFATAAAREYQAMVVAPPPAGRTAALATVSKQLCAAKGASRALYTSGLESAIANSDLRKQAVRAFDDVLNGYVRRELPPCT